MAVKKIIKLIPNILLLEKSQFASNYIWAIPKYTELCPVPQTYYSVHVFVRRYLSNQLEILTQHPQSSQDHCYESSNMFSVLIQDFLDQSAALQMQTTVSAYL